MVNLTNEVDADWFKENREKDIEKGSVFSRNWHRNREVQRQAEELDNNSPTKIRDGIKEQVWPEDVNKSPSWQEDDDLTQQTQQWVESVLDLRDPLWNEYKEVPESAGLRVQQVIKEALTQPQGWSLDSIVNNLDDEFSFMDKWKIERIVRQEVAATLNEAQIVAMQAQPDEPTVKWTGPDDQDTTELCQEAKSRIGDGVPVSKAIEILEELAKKYKDEGGTPNRASQGLPHFQCRHTLEEV